MRKPLITLFIVGLAMWIFINPPGKFGLHFFGFTVYSGIPIPFLDMKIHVNGLPGLREKTHYVSVSEVKELLAENPEAIIIGTGYEERVTVDPKVRELEAKIIVLETSKAIEKFNSLKKEGEKVAAIIHTTC